MNRCLFCSWLIFEPRYSNDEVVKITNMLRRVIEVRIKDNQTNEQDSKFLALALKAYEIINCEYCMRKELIRFRNELEHFKVNTDLKENRLKLVELSIKIVTTLHYATFICTTAKSFDHRVEQLKSDFDYFKELGKGVLDSHELLYLRTFYKLTKIMKIKRGFKSPNIKSAEKSNAVNNTDMF